MLRVVNDDGTTANGFLIDEIVREGARRMLAAAPEAEVNACMAELADQRDETGRRLVVRNGCHQPRQVTTAALAMVFKLVESARARWRAVNAPHLVALVRAGARFERGRLVERLEQLAA